MSRLVRSTIVSVVNLLIKLMLLGNQQEIVAFSWNSWIFYHARTHG